MKRIRVLSEQERALWAHVAKSIKPENRDRMRAAHSMAEMLDAPSGEGMQTGYPMGAKAAATDKPVGKVPGQAANLTKTGSESDPRANKGAESRAAYPALAPIERRLRQRLSRGQRLVDAKIDLHGLRQDEAQDALIQFLARSHAHGAGVVLVVTGKGRSKSEPTARAGAWQADNAQFLERMERGILNRMVPLWLAAPNARRFVIGFETAAAHHGGSGALYVRIRRAR